MKKIHALLVSIITITVVGCATYPRQSKGTRPVPPIKSFYTQMPRQIKMAAGITRIHDDKKNAWALFKGQDDDLLLDSMTRWLDPYVDEGEDSARIPIVLVTGTDVEPLTLLTKKDLQKASRTEKNQLIEMTRYRTYDITIPIFTYADLLTDEQKKEYHLTVVTTTTANGTGSNSRTSTKKSDGVSTDKSSGDRGNAKRIRRKG